MASTVISCSVHLKKSVFAQRMWHNCHLTALSCLTDWVTELGWHSIHIQSKHSKEISPSQRSVSLSNRTPIHPLHDELFSHVELWKIYKNEKLAKFRRHAHTGGDNSQDRSKRCPKLLYSPLVEKHSTEKKNSWHRTLKCLKCTISKLRLCNESSTICSCT